MKIISVQPYSYNRQKTNCSSMSTVAKPLQNDVFVKSKSVSFKGDRNFVEFFEPFQKEFLALCREKKEFKFDELNTFVKKYVPNLEVKRLSEVDSGANVHDRTAAYFKDEMFFTPDGRIRNGQKVLFINSPEMNSEADRVAFSQFFVHEMTHAFQETSSDRLSKFEFFKGFLGGKSLDDDKLHTLLMVPKLYSMVEYNYGLPLINVLKKENEIPLPIRVKPDENIIDNIYREQVGGSADEYLDALVERVFEILGKPSDKQNFKTAKKYLVLIAQKEKEAYEKGLAFTKSLLNIDQKTPTDIDLRVKLYEMFVKRLEKIAES